MTRLGLVVAARAPRFKDMAGRLGSLLLFLVMLNVTASSSGLIPASRVMPDMPGMDMSQTHGSSHGDPQPSDEGCKFPWSPGCTAFSPCAPVALIATASESALSAPSDHTPVVLVVRVPASADRSTDHRPPRA